MIEFSCQAIDGFPFSCCRYGSVSDREVAAHFGLIIDRRTVEARAHAALVLDDIRLDTFGWLVEQNEVGICYQHAPDRQLLLLSAGHGAGALAPALGEDRECFHD